VSLIHARLRVYVRVSHRGAFFFVINAKKTAFYTHVNGDRRSHTENTKIKKLYYYNAAHRHTSMCGSLSLQTRKTWYSEYSK